MRTIFQGAFTGVSGIEKTPKIPLSDELLIGCLSLLTMIILIIIFIIFIKVLDKVLK